MSTSHMKLAPLYMNALDSVASTQSWTASTNKEVTNNEIDLIQRRLRSTDIQELSLDEDAGSPSE